MAALEGFRLKGSRIKSCLANTPVTLSEAKGYTCPDSESSLRKAQNAFICKVAQRAERPPS